MMIVPIILAIAVFIYEAIVFVNLLMGKYDEDDEGGVEKMAEKHKCHECKYKGEHQEMKFQPFGVCRKETNLVEAEKAYRAKECPYGVGKKVE